MLKKTVCFVSLLLVLNFISFSQTKGSHFLARLNKIDSTKPDSIAIKLLEEISSREKLPISKKLDVNLRLLIKLYNAQQFDKAVTLGNKSIVLAQKNKLDSIECQLTKHLGNTYYYMDLRNKAKVYYRRAYEIANKLNSWDMKSSCSHNLGAILTDLREFREGEYYLYNSINIAEKNSTNNPRVYLTLRVLGALYMQTNQFDKAEKIFLGLKEKLNSTKDTNLITSNLIYYSTLLKTKGDTLKAVEVSEEALSMLRKKSEFHSLVLGLRTHGANLADARRYKEAYELDYEAFNILKKSYNNDVDKKISETEVKYRTAKIQQEKEHTELQSKKEKQLLIISTIGLLFILTSIFFIFNQRNNAKQKIAFQQQRLESLIEGEEKERSRIAKDLHDGIVQDLTAINLKLQGFNKDDSFLNEISNEIDSAAKEVRDIAYQMMPIVLREYGLIPALQNLLQKTLQYKNITFDFDTVNIGERLSEKIEVCLYRITQELLNNVIKHSKASYVSIVISKHNDFISLIIEDNGTGFNEDEVKKGIGMTSLSSRLEVVNGKLKFESTQGNGTTVIIRIPV